jgi:hypothetical protein
MDTGLVRDVARALRYRPLDHLVGRSVEVHDLDEIEENVHLALGPDLPEGCRLVGPELHFREGAVAKYGILDLRFSAPGELLTEGDVRTGVALLRELGFLPGGETGPQQRVCDDPLCLEMIQEELAKGQVYLQLFLEGGRPSAGLPYFPLRVPDGYLPRAFRIADACVTNAELVWLWKHFYL